MIRVYVTEEQKRFNERRDKLQETCTNESMGGGDWDDDHSTIGVSKNIPIGLVLKKKG